MAIKDHTLLRNTPSIVVSSGHIFSLHILLEEYLRDFTDSPVVKTLLLHCRGTGSIPSWDTKIVHAAWHSQKIKNKKFEHIPPL